jgi:hypothetical protein
MTLHTPVVDPSSAQQLPGPRADARVRPHRSERRLDPAAHRLDERDFRLRAHGADVELDQNHGAARAQRVELAAQDLLAIGQVEQQQARDDRVERLTGREGPRVRLQESDVLGACGRAPALGDLEQSLRLIDAEHRAAGIEEVGHLEGHVPEAGPEVQHAHPTADPRRAQQRLRRPRDRARLPVEPRDLRVVASEDVARADRRGAGAGYPRARPTRAAGIGTLHRTAKARSATWCRVRPVGTVFGLRISDRPASACRVVWLVRAWGTTRTPCAGRSSCR